jgi:serralysin
MAVNIAPVNSVIPNYIAHADTDTELNFLSVFDADAGSGILSTTLSVQHGTLSLGADGGATLTGNGTGTVAISGTLAQIVAALGLPGNVVYRGLPDFFGTDKLTMTTDDNGNSGTGGALSDTDVGTITVKPLVSGSAADDSFAALAGNETIDGQGGIDTITFGFKLTDAKVSYAGDIVTIDGPSSHTVLKGFEVFQFADGTVNNNDGNPQVDDLFYYAHNPDVWAAGVDADQHYETFGRHEGRAPSADAPPAGHMTWAPLPQHIAPNGFDYSYYLLNNPDVAAAGVDPLEHFQTFGWKEGRNPNAYFDTAGYLAAYADVRAAGVNPFDHYNEFGWHEGRDPSANFDTTDYLAAYPDVAAAHVNPLTHFLQFGINEGRLGFADGVWG